MNRVDDIDALTTELTNFLLKAKGEINRLKTQSKQDNDFKKAVNIKFKEIQEENKKLKQKLIEYDSYHKATALQKKRNARAAHRIRENQELGKKNTRKITRVSYIRRNKKILKIRS